jgi:hypothetical protein
MDPNGHPQRVCMGNGSEKSPDEDAITRDQRFQILCDQCIENCNKIIVGIEAERAAK